MKLTPMDISNKEFKKGLRGYNVDEVEEFIDDVVENYEEMYKENTKLNEKIVNLNEKVEYYSKIETTIQNTLLLAQNAAEQAKTSAKKESELMLKNANETAQKVLDKSHNDVIQINDEYEKVKQEFVKFRAKYRNFMNTQLETFDDMEKDFIRNYNLSENFSEDTSEKEINGYTKNDKQDVSFKKDINAKEIETSEDKEIETNKSNSEEVSTHNMNDELSEIKSFFANNSDS